MRMRDAQDGALLDGILHLVVVDEFSHLVGDILVHPVFQHLVHGVGAGHLLQDALLADVENFRQGAGHHLLRPGRGILRVVQGVVHLLGGEEDGLRRGGDGQNSRRARCPCGNISAEPTV